MEGQVEAKQAELGALIADLAHVIATIRVSRPDIDLAERIMRKRGRDLPSACISS